MAPLREKEHPQLSCLRSYSSLASYLVSFLAFSWVSSLASYSVSSLVPFQAFYFVSSQASYSFFCLVCHDQMIRANGLVVHVVSYALVHGEDEWSARLLVKWELLLGGKYIGR